MTPGPPHVRIAWGRPGLEALVAADAPAAVVIVDVLRFTTAVCTAVGRGARVFPYPWDDPGAAAFAAQHGAELAGRREDGGWSLSPVDLERIPPGTKLVLPSPNGSALSFAAAGFGVGTVVAACLRNATAAGRASARAAGRGATVGVVAAGEHDAAGDLRLAAEDLVGAGAVVAGARAEGAQLSDAAEAAAETFEAAAGDLRGWIEATSSGRELIGWGFGDDVAFSAVHDASDVVPVLIDGIYVALESAP